MSVLGFGSIEEEEQVKIRRYLISGLIRGEDVFTLANSWNAKRKEYDQMSRETAPERYTAFHVYDGAIHFEHINRRHPFSPDGWAMLQVTECLEEKP